MWLGQFHCYFEDDDGNGWGSRNGVINGRYSYVDVNNPSNNRWLRLQDLRNPSSDIILIDLLLQEGNMTQFDPTVRWTVAHGSAASPMGVNQGYADGSVRWHNFSELNTAYKPAYSWDRKVTLPYHRHKNSKFNWGGYPKSIGWTSPSPGWVGVGRHGLSQKSYDPTP